MNIEILLPSSITKLSEIAFKGFIEFQNKTNSVTIYVTQLLSSDINLSLNDNNCTDKLIYGCFGTTAKKLPRSLRNKLNYIEIESDGRYEVKNLIIKGKKISEQAKYILLFYDYEIIQNSELMSAAPVDMFTKLHTLIQSDCWPTQPKVQEKYNPVIKKPNWLASSMFGRQMANYAELIIWVIRSIARERKISIKQGNAVIALMTDILLGYLLLRMIRFDGEHLSEFLMGYLEIVVNYLRSLMKWLMGAPAGLKLNTAFNNMLGKFFLYHIELWWMFLELVRGGLDVVIHIYYYFGYMGITFQAAIISDMMFFVTFHLYCIYVYVARLFYIQVSGVIALMRLFVGRKYNPLRGGVDSCEYTNQELFVGTVAFTILIFLLPTTAMYYIVFTLFRLMSLAVQYSLSRLINLIETLPLYVFFLWLVGSSRVAGNVFVDFLKDQGPELPMVLQVKVYTESLSFLVQNNNPTPVDIQQPIEWTTIISSVLRGLIISPI